MSAKQPSGPKPVVVDGAALTPAMAAVLLDHANGPRAVRAMAMELRLLRSLRARKLIRFNRPTRPKNSIATTRGREIIVALLARQAGTRSQPALLQSLSVAINPNADQLCSV